MIQVKLYKNRTKYSLSVIFNETYVKKELLPKYLIFAYGIDVYMDLIGTNILQECFQWYFSFLCFYACEYR